MERKAESMPGILFHALNRAHRNAVTAALTQAGLSDLGSPLILMILQSRGKDGEIRAQRELADALHVSPATIAMSLKSLERVGYVEKRMDDADGRRKRISITAKGAQAVEKTWVVMRQVDHTMMEGFSEEERRALNSFHHRMLNNLSGAGDPPQDPFERMGCTCSKP